MKTRLIPLAVALALATAGPAFADEPGEPLRRSPALDEPVLTDPDSGNFLEGLHYTGGTIGYSVDERDNRQNLLGQRQDLEATTLSFEWAYGKFIRPGVLVGGGLQFDWASSDETLNGTDLLGRPTVARSESSEYQVGLAPFIRYYIPLGDGETGQLYVGLALALFYGWGEDELTDADGVRVERPIQRYGFDLQLRPGVSLYLLQGVALDLSIGSLGLEAAKEEIGKGDDRSERVTSDLNLNLDLDLLTVNIGLVYYF